MDTQESLNQFIKTTQPRRQFLRPATALMGQQHEAGAETVSDAASANIATFDGIWRTGRDRFYDPHGHGLDWSAVGDRTMPNAARATHLCRRHTVPPSPILPRQGRQARFLLLASSMVLKQNKKMIQ
jgi:hypothetical protein